MRKPKKHIDFFSHDTNSSDDDDMAYLQCEHGLNGYAIWFKLLERVYGNSYYLNWIDRNEKVVANSYGLSFEAYLKIFDTFLEIGMINNKMFADLQIVTSASIQTRYCMAKRRANPLWVENEKLVVPLKDIYAISERGNSINGKPAILLVDGEEWAPGSSERVYVHIKEQNEDISTETKTKTKTKTKRTTTTSLSFSNILEEYNALGPDKFIEILGLDSKKLEFIAHHYAVFKKPRTNFDSYKGKTMDGILKKTWQIGPIMSTIQKINEIRTTVKDDELNKDSKNNDTNDAFYRLPQAEKTHFMNDAEMILKKENPKINPHEGQIIAKAKELMEEKNKKRLH
jgi:hypothetical protein